MQQIAGWLEKLGMSEYTERFAENGNAKHRGNKGQQKAVASVFPPSQRTSPLVLFVCSSAAAGRFAMGRQCSVDTLVELHEQGIVVFGLQRPNSTLVPCVGGL